MLKTFTKSTVRLTRVAQQGIKLRFNQIKDDVRGVAAIEMAFIFPVMLILYFGLVDVTNLLSANRRVTLTSSTMADLVTQAPGTVSTADLQGFFNAAAPIMDPFSAADIGLELFSYSMNGGNAQLEWENRSGGASCGATPAASAEMIALMNAGTGLVVARVCYKWVPLVGKVMGSDPIQVEDQMILRPRQSNIITCTDCP